jgi:hypothetical protein
VIGRLRLVPLWGACPPSRQPSLVRDRSLGTEQATSSSILPRTRRKFGDQVDLLSISPDAQGQPGSGCLPADDLNQIVQISRLQTGSPHDMMLWNRMSSGSYLPPPVRAVSIPKKSGGQRILAVPTVADRVAQMVIKQLIEPDLDPMFLADSYGYRPRKSALDAVGVTRKRCWKHDWVVHDCAVPRPQMRSRRRCSIRSFFQLFGAARSCTAQVKARPGPWGRISLRIENLD